MVTTYTDFVPVITSGTTQNTYGTAVNLTLNDRAQFIIGMVVSGCDTIYTTAQGAGTLLQVSSNSLNKPTQTFLTGPWTTSGPATNGSGQGMIPDIIRLGWACGPNAVVTFAAARTQTVTTGASIMVSLIYSDGTPPSDFLTAFPDVLGANGGVSTFNGQLTVARTALPVIVVPKWARAVVGYRVTALKTGAITAGQSDQCIVDFQYSQAGVQPQIIPSNSIGATLGTPVGNGLYHDWIPFIPSYVPLTGTGDVNVTPYVTLMNAVSTGNGIAVSIIFR